MSDDFALGADIGPGLQRVLKTFPTWIQDQFRAPPETLAGPAFSLFAWQLGYGKDPKKGLPADQHALTVIANPDDPFWRQTPERVKDRDKSFAAATDWLKKANIKATVHYTLGPLEAIAKIPILGPVIKAAASPITTVAHLAEGQPVGQAMVDNFKSQVGAIKAVGPYAAAVVSFVPGIGTGVAAALAAGTALAEGKPIDEALEAGVKGAIPGGALVASGYELAKKVASGENVGKAALEAARVNLPPEMQKAFDIGLAVVTGKQLQSAIISTIGSLAPDQVKQIFDTGAKAIAATPGLSNLAKTLPSDIARQGAQLAAGALAHAGVNESQIRAMRSKLTGDVLHGFDSVLNAQTQHYPWLESVAGGTSAPAANPLAQLTPTEQQSLVDYANLQKLAQLTPEQRAQLQAAAAPKPTPKPGEPPKKPSEPAHPTAAAKPSEPSKAAPKPSEPTRSPAPASAAQATPAPGPHSYGPYPQRGTLSGAPSGYGTYPRALLIAGIAAPPPQQRPHLHHDGDKHPAVGRSWANGRAPWWGAPWSPEVPSMDTVCRVWGAPIEMPPAMQNAARIALSISKGQSTAVRGPDGMFYLFSVESGAMTARPCASFG